jgi:hypothetical protein
MTRTPIPVSVLTEAALSKRSSLYVWMLENHDTFAGVVAKAGRPNWSALAEAFGNQGYRDSDDKPPSAEGTRQTWWRVRKMVQARQAKAAQRAAAPTPVRPTPRPVSQPKPQSTPTSTTAPSPMKDGGLSDVLRAMDANKGQMPKPFK